MRTRPTDSYSLRGFYYEPSRVVVPKAKEAALRALELDPNLGEAHVSMGWVKCFYEWDFAEAEREFKRGIELNPKYATAYQWYANLLATAGRLDEAIEQNRIALELDPMSRIINSNYGLWLAYSGRHQEAQEQLRKTLELDSSWAIGHQWLGEAYLSSNSLDEAIVELERAAELSDVPLGLGQLGFAYAQAGRMDEARATQARLDELSKTQYAERASNLPLYRYRPAAGILEQDPRFNELYRRIGLEE